MDPGPVLVTQDPADADGYRTYEQQPGHHTGRDPPQRDHDAAPGPVPACSSPSAQPVAAYPSRHVEGIADSFQ